MTKEKFLNDFDWRLNWADFGWVGLGGVWFSFCCVSLFVLVLSCLFHLICFYSHTWKLIRMVWSRWKKSDKCIDRFDGPLSFSVVWTITSVWREQICSLMPILISYPMGNLPFCSTATTTEAPMMASQHHEEERKTTIEDGDITSKNNKNRIDLYLHSVRVAAVTLFSSFLPKRKRKCIKFLVISI